MNKPSAFSSFIKWIGSTEMFARPSKQLPGKWQLFEYYYEPGDQLVHVMEDQLMKGSYRWMIVLGSNGKLYQETNIPVKFLEGMNQCTWDYSGGFITIVHPVNPDIFEKLQFAVEKGILKLLKKELDGKIIFFGFFRKIDGQV